MWFRFDTNTIYRSQAFKRCLHNTHKNDNASCIRAFIFIQILAESANNSIWDNAKNLSKDIQRPFISCRNVWDICIDEGVLRNVDGGYNASEWMHENGLMGDTKQTRRKPCDTGMTNRDRLAETTKNIF